MKKDRFQTWDINDTCKFKNGLVGRKKLGIHHKIILYDTFEAWSTHSQFLVLFPFDTQELPHLKNPPYEKEH